MQFMKYLLLIVILAFAGCCKEEPRVVLYIPADKQDLAMAKELELIRALHETSGGYSPEHYAAVAHEHVLSIYGVPTVQRKSE